MIRRRRGTGYAATPGSTGSDTDALQTDVMRFMSILGLCLMAVFALVQSIPLHDRGDSRTQQALDKLHRDIALQQRRAAGLQAELEHLDAQVRAARSGRADARQALAAAQQQLLQVVDETQRARGERTRVRAELDELQRTLVQGRKALAGLEQAARDETLSLRKLRSRLRSEQRRLDDITQRAEALEHRHETAPPVPPAETKRPPPEPASAPQGFTLRFASAAALHRLVVGNTVSLYAMAGKQAWRLSLDTGRPVFTPDSFPGWFHEMAAATVPPEYVRTLVQSRAISAAPSVVWGVQLPPATKQGIATLTRGRQGGDLVIDASGRVRLETE